MEVILLEDVRNLGEMGDIVDVADGYGRNYLIPQGMAEPATAARKDQIEHQLTVIEARKEKERAAAREIVGDIDGVSISVPARVAEDDQLYGSVTARDIVDVLGQQGIEVTHKQVQLDEPVRELGIYKIPIKLASGIFAYIRLWVVAM
ncbi:50S ribosomal protein L9 [Persicimonas caeni]|uniref:Large ribosomal subunit protein bL9 n=1 Tax=Persicimonas caeni TaxID=2292766 RepID=A0A4Y6PP27_PERCE|nr:50S ribosomal protein L9 [Persicimonas caeni]QDG50086.1 50S ribosomal protein L9 [Persicimonas caeni]QED31307.1 50S ribosomal protein L9 [Persicimonas caeni]